MRMETSSPPPEVRAVLDRVDLKRAQLLGEASSAIESLASAGTWQWAIKAVIKSGLSQADIARGLEVTRSTVMRWDRGETSPPASAIPSLKGLLLRLLK